jgi:hypothetical protein
MCRGAAANAKEGCEQLAKQTAITNSKMNTNRSRLADTIPLRTCVFKASTGQKNDVGGGNKKGLGTITLRSPADHSSALAWLSLIGLLASRARLRFTKQQKYTPQKTKPTASSAERTSRPRN